MANSRIKVLLVDDEAQFRATTEKVLSRRGFEVLLAADGREALQKAKLNPDVIILDIRMPGMDGLEALREIKQITSDVPVIMLTGHGSGPAAEQALKEGAFDFLAKPCDIDLLASKIKEAHRSEMKTAGGVSESLVRDLMIPLDVYTTLGSDATVADAVEALRNSVTRHPVGDSVMETSHSSVLVQGANGQILGLLVISDLLEAIMPQYLSAPKPSTADSIQYSPMFWAGMFTNEVRKLAKYPIGELMSPTPPKVRADSSLLEAAYLLIKYDERRLIVYQDDQVVGVIREQDLFFEMARLMQK